MLEEVYCYVDDFYQKYAPMIKQQQISSGKSKRFRASKLSNPEIITIMILFHQSHYRNFKHFYLDHVCQCMRADFPNLVSYNRFVELKTKVLIYVVLLSKFFESKQTGIYFVDSTAIEVCHIKREKQNKVFKGFAKKSCSTKGYYFGFKLHLVVNDCGEIMNFKLTDSKTDDRKPLPELSSGLIGKLIGDKGYVSKKLTQTLKDKGLQLITKVRKNMKAQVLHAFDKALLRKRAIIESVNDQLKNISQIEHTRHRSIYNFMGNLLCGIIAYQLQPKKPSINLYKDFQCAAL